MNVVRTQQQIANKLARTAAAQLNYHGGPVLNNVEVTTIYWGSAWASDPLRTQLDEFFGFIVQSSLVDQLAEYSVPGQTIGRGRLVQSVLEMNSEPPNPCDDSIIQSKLDSLIANGTVGQPNANSVYFFFMPSGVRVTLQGASSCQDFCGYHNFSSSGVVYAVDTYDDCPGCQFVPGDTLASSTVVASHELCESITDPQLNAWFDDNTGEEIGDICEGSNKVISTAGTLTPAAATTSYTIAGTGTADAQGNIVGTITLTPTAAPPPPPPPPPPPTPPPPGMSWTVQREWSNAQGACV